ncbi:GNAT family N-acetyltransferase [Nonomuraea sp. NPDC059194]|uniref:GNAT family N-acetyltransferase n=1 Tax=Nonomuraea sp. NPDC059194 TaxID=3346764 RepID=UPI003697D2EA
MDRHTVRRPRPADAAAVHELVAAYDISVIGVPDVTLDDIADELAELDTEHDAWLAEDTTGTPNGWAWIIAKGDSDHADVEVVVRPGTGDGVTEHLWAAVVERSRELAAERGHEGVTLDIGVYRADEDKQALVKGLGFEAATSFHRLVIDFDGPVDAPRPPEGVTLHPALTDELRREAHRLHQEGFADHFGFVPVPYEEWLARRETSAATDWTQVLVARVDGEPAALLVGTNHFAEDENRGYVLTLTTLPAFRGRGLGRFLLRTAFAADAARGRRGTLLQVDANNTTPALGLYTSAGMTPVLAIDVWRSRIEALTA